MARGRGHTRPWSPSRRPRRWGRGPRCRQGGRRSGCGARRCTRRCTDPRAGPGCSIPAPRGTDQAPAPACRARARYTGARLSRSRPPIGQWLIFRASDWSVITGGTNLTHGHVVATKSADHQTRLSRIGFRAVAGKARTRDQASTITAAAALVIGDLLAPSVPVISVALSSSASSLHSFINFTKLLMIMISH